MPMESIHKKSCVLEEYRIAVKAIFMQAACKVIYNGGRSCNSNKQSRIRIRTRF